MKMENPEECKIKFLAYFETIDLFSVEKFYMCKSVSRLKNFLKIHEKNLLIFY